MNIRLITLLAIALSLFYGLCGCGLGYNRMLFVTKTNVGFEIDSTPPSLQLAIDRLEGVFAPQFEGGKKLPVMSSFKFESERGFSPYVGSAFATGDAAVVLSSLYADPTPSGDWETRRKLLREEKDKVDSSLTLNKKPEIKGWFPTLFGPSDFQGSDVRPVFFGTDTSLGIKVAWSGLSSYVPDTARLGYGRKEIAFVPITMEEKVETSQPTTYTTYRVKTSSLLATLDFGMKQPSLDEKGQPSAPQNYVQYFATGDAATLLSLQRTVRQAMLARLDPNAKKFAKEYAAGLAGEAKIQAAVFLQFVYDGLVMHVGKDAVKEAALIKGLDTIGQRLPKSYTLYTWNPDAKPPLLEHKKISVPVERNFLDVSRYYSPTKDSLDHLQKVAEKIKADPKFAFQEKEKDEAKEAVDVTPERKTQLMIEFKEMKESFDEFDQRLRSDPAVIEAATYFMDTLLPSK